MSKRRTWSRQRDGRADAPRRSASSAERGYSRGTGLSGYRFVVLAALVGAAACTDQLPQPSSEPDEKSAAEAVVVDEELVHDHTPHHGGTVGMSGDLHVEARFDVGGRVVVYLSDRSRVPIPMRRVSGVARLGQTDPRREEPLISSGDGAFATARFETLPPGFVELVELEFISADHAVQIEFALEVPHPAGYEVPVPDACLPLDPDTPYTAELGVGRATWSTLCAWTYDVAPRAAAVHTASGRLAVAAPERRIAVFDLHERRRVAMCGSGRDADVIALAFDEDRETLLASRLDGLHRIDIAHDSATKFAGTESTRFPLVAAGPPGIFVADSLRPTSISRLAAGELEPLENLDIAISVSLLSTRAGVFAGDFSGSIYRIASPRSGVAPGGASHDPVRLSVGKRAVVGLAPHVDALLAVTLDRSLVVVDADLGSERSRAALEYLPTAVVAISTPPIALVADTRGGISFFGLDPLKPLGRANVHGAAAVRSLEAVGTKIVSIGEDGRVVVSEIVR